MQRKTFKITDEDGIHARPATALVNTANKFKGTDAFVESKGKKVVLKSLLGVLSLGLECGDIMTIISEGKDEKEVMAALQDVMINEGLGEIYE